MFHLKQWHEGLDLSEFYEQAKQRGFVNNASQAVMIDCFKKEKEWAAWILYYNDRAVGSVAAHHFPEMGEDAYRIAVRTCVFTNMLSGPYSRALRTISVVTQHQNPTAQFLIPTCINWAKSDNLYITSNESDVGTQSKVNNIFCPAMEKKKLMYHADTIFYRGLTQKVWKVNPREFIEDLEKYPKWT